MPKKSKKKSKTKGENKLAMAKAKCKMMAKGNEGRMNACMKKMMGGGMTA